MLFVIVMLITFDLDDTLICRQEDVPVDPVQKPWYFWWFTPMDSEWTEQIRREASDIILSLHWFERKIGRESSVLLGSTVLL